MALGEFKEILLYSGSNIAIVHIMTPTRRYATAQGINLACTHQLIATGMSTSIKWGPGAHGLVSEAQPNHPYQPIASTPVFLQEIGENECWLMKQNRRCKLHATMYKSDDLLPKRLSRGESISINPGLATPGQMTW